MRGGDCLRDQGRVVGIWRIAERNHEEEEMGVWRWLLASGEEVTAGGAAAVWGMAVVARVGEFGRRKHRRRGQCWTVAGGEDSGWGFGGEMGSAFKQSVTVSNSLSFVETLIICLFQEKWVQRSNNRSLNIKKTGKKEHHLWMKRDSAGSGQKALNLVQIVSKLPSEKEAIYGELDKWTAWETEFPVIAAAKALEIMRKRNQWLRIIQVSKWLLSKGQVLTMGTYDTLLLALDMEGRIDEAETIWNVILQTHTRSVSKRLFSRMIALYEHHHVPEKIVEVFADMEELGVKPDDDTVRRIARAFEKLGQVENQKLVLKKYQNKWKYLHFNGERVRVRNPEYMSK
ncbi:uncharacterized protein A4U43_C03F9830 [Asparagus officinalis]|uniref:Pentacotripeptide-repeat region of PRORP domain-containing protein n=2 Tax=Asparagus officinalis TaxID=4686 RepID=A0A5P1F8P5_ASPOF|nr:uncharacterized protein A4U43_C03F9830 [Asparagus officinalis]